MAETWMKLPSGVLAGSVGASFLLLYALRRFLSPKSKGLYTKDWEPNVVYLYQFNRIKCVPNISPFAMKLETWLRLKNIPYRSIEGNKFSRGGGQVPFVELNGEEIFDSNVIIPRLREIFKAEDEDIDDQSKGAGLAITRMLDEHFVHSYFWYRYVDHWLDEFYPLWTFPINAVGRFFLTYFQPRFIRKKGVVIGHGRLPYEVIYQLGMEDLKALSLFLGDKKFLMGDRPSSADCSAIGHLAQILYIPINHPHKTFLVDQCPNLGPYVERVKEELWPDWQEILDKVPW